MKKLIRNRLSTKCTALLLLMAMLFSVISVFPFHVYSAASTGTIADGVYTISNNYLTDNYSSYGSFYLRANCLVSENNSTPSVYMSTDTYGDFRFNLLRYWKVEHLGNEVYVFRSLADPNQMLGRSGSTVTLIKTDGTTIPNSVKWKYNSGYWKSVSNENQCLTARNTPSAAPSHYNSALYHYYVDATVMNAEYMSFDRFSLTSVSVTGACWRNEQTGNLVTSFSSGAQYIMQDDIFSPDELGYSLVAYKNSSPVSATWSSNNTSVATVNSATGVVTPKNYGSATITASTTAGSISYTVPVRMLPDGTYFLRNLQNGMYADIEGGTMSSGIAAEQQTFDGANTQKWIFTHIGSNVYTIRSTKNNSYYLGIQNDSTADDTPIVLRTGTPTNGMKWKVEKGDEGYKIVSYSNSTRVLCTSTASATAGSNLKLSDFEGGNESYQDEWLLSLPSSQLRLEGQQTNKWCWVASAKIASYRYQDSPITQACAAVYVKLNNTITMHPDTIEEFSNIQTMTGSTEDIKEALEYITGVECFKAWKYIYSEGTLQSLLDNNIPVIITRGVYEPKGSGDATKENSGMERTSGHATVINSYRWNDAINDYEYEIYDPWEPNIGNIKYCTYEQIYNGVTSDYDNKIWDGVVTFAQGNYSTLENWSGTQ